LPFLGREMQRSPSLMIVRIDIGTRIYQQPCDGNMAI